MPSHVAPFLPDRFRSAVPFYVKGRLDYPPRLIESLAAWLGVTSGERVLDLGCGPGFLALAFAELGYAVTGMDPDRSMLAAAKELATRRGVACEFREGSSYDLQPALGSFTLVTMGRSFHWMDRVATLAALDSIVEPRGAIALFRDHHIKCRENLWVEAFERARLRFEDRDDFSKRRKSGEVDGHETVLLNSAFSRLDKIGVIERRSITLDGLVARALSYSASSPEKLGERRSEFEAAIQEAVSPFAENDTLSELVDFTALIARRPSAPAPTNGSHLAERA